MKFGDLRVGECFELDGQIWRKVDRDRYNAHHIFVPEFDIDDFGWPDEPQVAWLSDCIKISKVSISVEKDSE